MKAPKIVLRKVKDIKRAAYNPPSRSEKAVQSGLRTSIEEIGLQQPLLISPNDELVDGHRRLACLEDIFGPEEEVPCVITATGIAEAYSAVNTTISKMNGHDMLHLFLNGGALTVIQKGKCERALEVLGEQLLHTLYKKGFSLNVLLLAQQTARYIGQEDNKNFVRQTVRWIMKFGVPPMRQAMQLQTRADTLRNAVQNNKALNLRVADVEEETE